jgi:hypothetical protein
MEITVSASGCFRPSSPRRKWSKQMVTRHGAVIDLTA